MVNVVNAGPQLVMMDCSGWWRWLSRRDGNFAGLNRLNAAVLLKMAMLMVKISLQSNLVSNSRSGVEKTKTVMQWSGVRVATAVANSEWMQIDSVAGDSSTLCNGTTHRKCRLPSDRKDLSSYIIHPTSFPRIIACFLFFRIMVFSEMKSTSQEVTSWFDGCGASLVARPFDIQVFVRKCPYPNKWWRV